MTYAFIHSKLCVTDEILMLQLIYYVSVFLRDRPVFFFMCGFTGSLSLPLGLFSRLFILTTYNLINIM
jgi:hypothetical protein